MKITLLACLMSVLLFGTVHSVKAEEQITGAFGIKPPSVRIVVASLELL